MKGLFRLLVPVLLLCAATPVMAQVQESSFQPSVQAAPEAPDTTPLLPITLAMAGAITTGAAAAAKVRKMNLSQTYIFNGETFGPGLDIVVPDDFPDLNEDGSVKFEPGSPAARNQARARSFSSPPSTGGVNTGEGQSTSTTSGASVSGKTTAELSDMTVAELDDLAVQLEVPVPRLDGGEGDPLKSDYIAALSGTK